MNKKPTFIQKLTKYDKHINPTTVIIDSVIVCLCIFCVVFIIIYGLANDPQLQLENKSLNKTISEELREGHKQCLNDNISIYRDKKTPITINAVKTLRNTSGDIK